MTTEAKQVLNTYRKAFNAGLHWLEILESDYATAESKEIAIEQIAVTVGLIVEISEAVSDANLELC